MSGIEGTLNSAFLNHLDAGARRACSWLRERVRSDGSYGLAADDLACYYKAPYLFLVSGDLPVAQRVLSHTRKRFMAESGDFETTSGIKSANEVLNEYWSYPNAWIAMAAQKMGRFDVAVPAYGYLKSFFDPATGRFMTHAPGAREHAVSDVLTTAHLGLMRLYFGDLDGARLAARALERFLELQSEPAEAFYLRISGSGDLIRTFPDPAAILYRVSVTEPDQAYFMLGYPVAFLARLHAATGESRFIDLARRYLDLALSCSGNVRAFVYSHKLAWGAAAAWGATGEARYGQLTRDIAEYLLEIQHPDGCWLPGEPDTTSYDQTTEIAIWLLEICAEAAVHDTR